MPRSLLSSLFLCLLGVVFLMVPLAAHAAVPAAVIDDHVTVSTVPQRSKVHPGDQFAIAVILDFAEGWHAWPNKPVVPPELEGVDATPTEVKLSPNAALPPGTALYLAWTQWPQPHKTQLIGAEVLAYSDRSVAFIPVVVDAAAKPGPYSISLTVSYQACNDNTCDPPTSAVSVVTFDVVPVDVSAADQKPELFKDFSPAVFSRILAGETIAEDWQFDFIGAKFSVRKDAYALILLIAFIAGVLMNFTPCVIPVIPIKILSLQAHAKTPAKLVYFGIIYCIGIVLLYAILGLLAFGLITGGKRFDWGQLFSLPWFSILMAVIVAAMGIGMTVGLSIRLPNFVYMVNPTGDTALGNLIGGLLTGVLATPCTGPLLGAAFAWAFAQPPVVGLSAITMMGVGMAAPYALLIAFPKLLNKMPRGGPGSELLKQVMGIFMLAVAAYLAGNLTDAKWPWWAVGGIAIAACLWLVVGAWRMLRTTKGKIACTVIAVVGMAGSYWVAASLADEGPLSWSKFRNKPDSAVQAAIERELRNKKVVVVDFTAKWCVNCQFIEKATLNSDTGVELLTRPDVALIKVDLTNAEDDQGWGVVRQVAGGGGIPLIAVFGPGVEKPIYFQSFFKTADLADAVSKARGR